uniref:Uncharacterized protein n=1 Tax=Timema monikensis TaxID=170555 RepID=A0A7R9DZI5_9NEOP|nr:unnamed protein product [Timema monikensis]
MLTTEDFKLGGQAVCHGATWDKSLDSSGGVSTRAQENRFNDHSEQSEGKLSLSNVVLHVQERLDGQATFLSGLHCLLQRAPGRRDGAHVWWVGGDYATWEITSTTGWFLYLMLESRPSVLSLLEAVKVACTQGLASR